MTCEPRELPGLPGRRTGAEMTPYYQDSTITLHHGDSLEVLRTLPSGSVDCTVTSPPYFGLRSYLPGKVVLRSDLTPEQVAYVMAEMGDSLDRSTAVVG